VARDPPLRVAQAFAGRRLCYGGGMRPAVGGGTMLIRPARPADREAILDFCRDTWGPGSGDYVEHAIDRWLAGGDGMLAVVEQEGRAVASCYTRLMSPHEAFFSGMRVDPARRRSGLALALVEYCLAQAGAQGRTVARLIVDANNVAALGAVARARFHQVGSMTAWERSVGDRAGATRVPASLSTGPGGADRAPAPPPGALWAIGWSVRELTGDDVAERAANHHALALGEGLALLRPDEQHLWLAWLDGTPVARACLVEAALDATVAGGFSRCRALLASDPATARALSAAGFEHGLEYHVFERSIA
jgi:GNAT superfamily N-acetyltransferase